MVVMRIDFQGKKKDTEKESTFWQQGTEKPRRRESVSLLHGGRGELVAQVGREGDVVLATVRGWKGYH